MNLKYFFEYMARLNNTYSELTNEMEFVLPENSKPGQTGFYGAVEHVIDWFLDNQESSKLFLQIPVNELGSLKQAPKNFELLTETIINTIGVHCVDQLTKNTDPKFDDKENVFLSKPIKAHQRFFRYSRQNESFKEIILPSTKCLSLTKTRNEIEQWQGEKVKLVNVPEKLSVRSRNELTDNLVNYIEFISKARQRNRYQYKKILIIGYSCQDFDHIKVPVRILNSTNYFIDTPIYYSNKNQNLPRDVDIIVAIGDKKYLYGDLLNEINNKLNQNEDKLRKVILIGSHLDQTYNFLTYSFSFREISYYFRSGSFPQHQYVTLPFPEINPLEDSIRDFFTNTDLEIAFIDKIVAVVLYPLLSLEFNKASFCWDRTVEIIEELFCNYFIDLNQAIDYELIIKFTELIKDLDIPNKNPKKNYLENQMPMGNKIIIPSNKGVYKKKIKGILNKNCGNDIFIVDSLSSHNLEIYEYMLKSGIIGTFYFFCYKGYEDKGILRHKIYLNKEFNVYKSRLRTELTHQLFEMPTPLLALPDNPSQDAINQIRNERYNSSITYTVNFLDETKAQLSGDVIYDGRILGIEEIINFWEEKEEENITITYYENPTGIFDKIANIKRGYNLIEYIDLWKTRLKYALENKYNNDIESLFKDMQQYGFTKGRQLKNYLSDNIQVKFSRDMLAIVNFLKAKGWINDLERKHILGAKFELNENQKTGGQLKEELYNYHLKREIGDLLDRVIKNSAISLPDILNSAIFTKTVKHISQNN